jgi:hypothetical protein
MEGVYIKGVWKVEWWKADGECMIVLGYSSMFVYKNV